MLEVFLMKEKKCTFTHIIEQTCIRITEIEEWIMRTFI